MNKALYKIMEHDGLEIRTHYVFGEREATQTLKHLAEKEANRQYMNINTQTLVNEKEVERDGNNYFIITSPQDKDYVAELWKEPVRCVRCLTELNTGNIHSIQEIAACMMEAFCLDCAD